jgi:hypothetical protein
MKVAGIKLFGSRGGKVADDGEDHDDEVADDDEENNKVADESEESDADEVTGDDDDERVAHDDDEDDEDQVADDDDDMPKSKAARKVYARGRRAGIKAGIKITRKNDALIAQLCNLAEQPVKIDRFIAKGVSVDDVRESLLAGRASKSAATKISGLRNPNTTSKQIDTAAIYAKYNGAGGKARRA